MTTRVFFTERRYANDDDGKPGAWSVPEIGINVQTDEPSDWESPFQHPIYKHWAQERTVAFVREDELASERLAHEQTKRELAEYRDKYYDLLMSVGNVHKGETRHETAKRYILSVENQNNPAANAIAARPDDGGEGGK